MLGFVTSSYASVALERPFALALLDDGFERIGSTLTAVHNGVGRAGRGDVPRALRPGRGPS